MKHYAIKRADGGVAIMQTDGDPATEVERWHPNNRAEIALPRAIREIAPAEVPADRTFRGAWTDTGAAVAVDMPKARAIHMDRIRKVRDRELERLDVEQLKGKDVAAEKQKLRDLPATFDLAGAKNPGELKALWPADLPPFT